MFPTLLCLDLNYILLAFNMYQMLCLQMQRTTGEMKDSQLKESQTPGCLPWGHTEELGQYSLGSKRPMELSRAHIGSHFYLGRNHISMVRSMNLRFCQRQRDKLGFSDEVHLRSYRDDWAGGVCKREKTRGKAGHSCKGWSRGGRANGI